ncbi:MAG TPA: GGDEF domain-containing protein [Thermoanaerobaculia bacterium]|nr:GGDEF domain-containing protein [Thermoanaerobaculia bacterium]
MREKRDPINLAVRLVQELTSELAGCSSATDLFDSSFRILYGSVTFDVGVAVMVEQNLDLYIAGRPEARTFADERLFSTVRRAAEGVMPAPFSGTDIVVRSERYDLPDTSGRRDPMRHELDVPLVLKNRPAGVFVLCRHEKFKTIDRQLLSLFSAVFSTLHDSVHARKRIQFLADTDELTGIANRRYFRRQLPQEIGRARAYRLPLSLLMIDVDDFKEINDTFGHVVGDVVLSELCGTMRETLRTPDFIARYGGDEFAVTLPHTDLAGAMRVADRILSRLREVTIEVDPDRAMRCSVSIGVAELHPDDTSGRDLIRRADQRLYEAKKRGKNQYASGSDQR